MGDDTAVVTGTERPTSRLRPSDVLRVGASGPLARRSRTALSALGVSIGIAALVGVLGLSESSRSALLDEIAALGTNLLTVEAGSGFGGGDSTLPDTAVAAVARIPEVQVASGAYAVEDVDVLRNDLVDPGRTGGVQVVAADLDLLDTLNGTVSTGRWLDEVTATYPGLVLGSVAADRLGVRELDHDPHVLVGGQWVEVVGILDPFPLAPDLDRSVLLGRDAAERWFDGQDVPRVVYARVDDGAVDVVRDLVPGTADVQNPEEVTVSRPSDALEAQAAADSALQTLFLGLGAVALLVGGVGIANVMVIAVIERRGEIGLRRALGARRRHIRDQFLTEAVILSALGGLVGVAIGALVTFAYATSQGWRVIVPVEAAVGGHAAALVIGALAGLYPALRAANLPPTEALRG